MPHQSHPGVSLEQSLHSAHANTSTPVSPGFQISFTPRIPTVTTLALASCRRGQDFDEEQQTGSPIINARRIPNDFHRQDLVVIAPRHLKHLLRSTWNLSTGRIMALPLPLRLGSLSFSDARASLTASITPSTNDGLGGRSLGADHLCLHFFSESLGGRVPSSFGASELFSKRVNVWPPCFRLSAMSPLGQ